MYTDGPIFFGEWGVSLMAHHYNVNAGKHGGEVEAVWANKGKDDCVNGTCVLDLERGVVDRIWDDPWQTDTCIGSWHYNKEAVYKTPKVVAGGYRKPQRKPAAEFSPVLGRNAGLAGTRDSRGGHEMDGGERRSDLRNAALENIR
jgi:hypothetical protein